MKSGLLVFLFPIHVFFYNPKLYLSLRVVVTVMCILGKCGCFPLVPVFYGTLVVSLLFLPHSVLFVFLALPARWVLSCVLPLNFNCSLLSIEFSWNWCLLESWWVRLVEGKSHSHILLYSALTFPVWLTSPSSLARACGLSSLSLQTRQQKKKKNQYYRVRYLFPGIRYNWKESVEIQFAKWPKSPHLPPVLLGVILVRSIGESLISFSSVRFSPQQMSSRLFRLVGWLT